MDLPVDFRGHSGVVAVVASSISLVSDLALMMLLL